jgi:hypothetical protein
MSLGGTISNPPSFLAAIAYALTKTQVRLESIVFFMKSFYRRRRHAKR